MKRSFCITIDFLSHPLVKNVEFFSRDLALMAFLSWSFALPLSDCDSITLFENDTEISKTTFKH